MSDVHAVNAQRLVGLHPGFAIRVQQFLDHMDANGVLVEIVQGLRTIAEQDALYAQGRTEPGKIITNARGGFSQHNYGLAVDLCPFDPDPDWDISHPAWKSMLAAGAAFKMGEGAEWRTFPDNPHFYPVELPAAISAFREQFALGGLPLVWAWASKLMGESNAAVQSA